MTGGRPLRFLALVITGWVGARAMILWPVEEIAAAVESVIPRAVAAPRRIVQLPAAEISPYRALGPIAGWSHIGPRAGTKPIAEIAYSAAASTSIAPRADAQAGIVAGLPVILPVTKNKSRSRFFGSAWAVVRGGGSPAGGVPGVQLGGSQAGVRLGYALTADRHLAVVARASSPLENGMRELALGLEWQPTRLPVRLVAEQRFALGEGRGGPTLAAVGGLGPVKLLAGFRLEAYAQGGVIARDGAEGFADGALRVARPVATLGRVRVELGGGTWGAVQKGASRIDIGPSLSALVPIGPQPVRLSLDWRQRVAGNAAPGSGVVLTLGADF